MKACVVLIIAVLVVPLSGEVPPMMNYQGRLTDVWAILFLTAIIP